MRARLPFLLSLSLTAGCSEKLVLDSASLGGFLADAKDTGPAELFVGDLVAGDLVINELMVDAGAVTDSNGEWFELYNVSGLNIELDGLQVFDTSVGSPGDQFTVSGTLIVDAGGHVVLGRNGDTSANGGANLDYVYGTAHVLGNASDELFLYNGTAVIDSIAWDNGLTFPDPTGASISLDGASQDELSNDDGANWCTSRTTFGVGDAGSPGTTNDSCTAYGVGELAAGDLVIHEIFKDASAVTDSVGEWFEVFNAAGFPVDLDGLEVFDTDAVTQGDLVTVSGSVVVADGGYAVLGRNDDSGANGGVTLDYAYGTRHTLGNAADELFLGNGVSVIDSVTWDNGITWPDPVGASMTLAGSAQDATNNDSGANWCVATSGFGLGDLGTPGGANDGCGSPGAAVGDLVGGDLIITEIMKDTSAVTDANGEWFEIYNNSGGVVDLDGLQVFDTSTAAQTDKITVSGTTLVNAGAYFVLGRNDDVLANGGVTLDYEYGNGHTLGNAADEVFLYNGSTTLDSVSWDNGITFPDPTGGSLSLDPAALDATGNDDGGNWCVATSSYGGGDLGTPGSANDLCVLGVGNLVAGDLVINELMVDAGAVFDADGEWMELYNTTGSSIDLDGLEIYDTDSTTKGNKVTVRGSLTVAVGELVVLGRNADTGANGGVTLDYEYGTRHTLGNASDEVFIGVGTTVVDSVAYDNGLTFPDPTGATFSLDPDFQDETSNDDGASWCAATSTYGAGDAGTPGAVNDECTVDGSDLAVGDLIEGDLIITEILKDPVAVGDLRGEWIEVYNNTLVTIDLDGLQIFDTSTAVMGNLVVVGGSVPVLAGEYVVLGINADTGANGGAPVDYEYGTGHRLANTADEVMLYNGSVVIDQVAFDNGATFPSTAGLSLTLDADHFDTSENDDGANWCSATSTFGSGDSGTPGSANDDCDAGPGDADGDGYTSDVDCDDAAATINPGATEICDSVDNDCNGDIDDADAGITGQSTWYADTDADTFGDSVDAGTLACTQPANTVADSSDCDDGDAAINPGATEVCDGTDNDCDALVDDSDPGVTGQSTWYADGDADSYGDDTDPGSVVCSQPSNTVSDNTDCDDSDNGINPGEAEINGDGIDQDCDGEDSYTYSYVDDVEPIFVANCDGCHLSGATSGGFNMDNGTVDHVNLASSDVPSMDRFEPGDAGNSYIWHKLNNTQADVGGAGLQMPRGGPFLDVADLDLIETWILEGCPD